MTTFNKIVFYNGHQHGDLANSRGVVSYIANYLQDMDLYFIHIKDARSIFFHDKVKSYNISSFPYADSIEKAGINCIRMSDNICYIYEDIIFINLWIGRSPWFCANNQPKGYGITKESLLRLTYEAIYNIEHHTKKKITYPTSVLQTMPSSTTFPQHKTIIDDFISNKLVHYRKKIIIPNGPVESTQCPNFNMGDMIQNGGLIKKYPDVLFIFTAAFSLNQESNNADNVVFIDNIVPIPNLNEIDYLSRYCDALVTRASGPGCVYSTRDNYLDKSKTFISFTSSPTIAFEAMSMPEQIDSRNWESKDKAKMIWSNDFSEHNICNIIENSIKIEE